MKIESSHIGSLSMTVDIAARPADVWLALTDNIGQWWPADFYAGGVEGKRNYTLDAVPGGLMLESWEGGGGVLWGSVVCVDPGKTLQVLGSIFPSFGGPNQWFGTWEIEEKANDRSTLRFSESSMGRVSDGGTEEKNKGWQFLWACMKAHIEGEPEPAWPQ